MGAVRISTVALIFAVAVLTASPAPSQLQSHQAVAAARYTVVDKQKLAKTRREIHYLQARSIKTAKKVRYWQSLMGVKPARQPRLLAANNPWQARRLFKHWRHLYVRVHRRVNNPPPSMGAWLCIHGHEGSWNDTRNPTHYGGLQMDKYFEGAYGARFVLKYGGRIVRDAYGHPYAVGGHAYRWKPLEQIWTAVKAWRARGFSPWAETAPACGLY